jgi:copper ion binding protein
MTMDKTRSKFHKLVVAFTAIVTLALLSCSRDTKTEGKEIVPRPGPLKTAVIPVDGMMCMACVSRVKRELNALEGVDSVRVNLEGQDASVTFDDAKIDIKEIRQAINDLGYTAGEPKATDE